MTGTYDHCRIVGRSLTGARPVDEKTHTSMAVLTDRLERLQRKSDLFAGIELSPDVEALRSHAPAMTFS